MKSLIRTVVLLGMVIPACSLEDDPTSDPEKDLVYPITVFDSYSDINKTTSWFKTNRSFDQLFQVRRSHYWGFEDTHLGLIPFNLGTEHTWSPFKSYYWFLIGQYIYTDLTGDGLKDLWAAYHKHPWPTNKPGLHLFSEYEKDYRDIDLQQGLTQPRKCVLADITGDGNSEIVIFSHGYDGDPFSGDSIGIFYPRERQYQYLSDEIGFFHGGATGDINNSGRTDIVAHTFFREIIAYHNLGGKKFQSANESFINFPHFEHSGTLELFDMNNDGRLDLILGGLGVLLVIEQKDGSFDRNNAIELEIESNMFVLDLGFLDLNDDGKMDIIALKTINNYNGYHLSFYHNQGDHFLDVTDKYVDNPGMYEHNTWIAWIRLFDYDKDGDIDIVGDGLHSDTSKQVIFWKNDGGFFRKIVTK